jgi:uncharacterized protein (TIGR02600 family)
MKKKANRRGIALVLVLSFLVLISVLTVAFFSSITTELSASKTYADTAGTKMLADSAINLVMGTIKEATTQTNATWASQPGMIRAYGANAAPVAYYKLYSSDKFVVTDHLASYDPSSDVEPLWDQQAALYTDLNSPVFTPDPSDSTKTKPVFPIIDPRAMSATTGSSIEGFSYQKNNVDGVVEAGANADDQRLPMPARWLYLLKDGSIACPTGITNGAAIFGGDVIPSTANPIVGRIAFWTDDETCKININTAAGDLPSLDNSASGSFWDIPRIDSVLDHSFATSPPFQSEFQRDHFALHRLPQPDPRECRNHCAQNCRRRLRSRHDPNQPNHAPRARSRRRPPVYFRGRTALFRASLQFRDGASLQPNPGPRPVGARAFFCHRNQPRPRSQSFWTAPGLHLALERHQ